MYSVTYAADGKSFDFKAEGLPQSGYSYLLHYATKVEGAVIIGDVFGNKATVTSTETSSTYTATVNGGGEGGGQQYTRFTVSKTIAGEQAAAAADATFTVRYSVKGSTAAPRIMSLNVGQPIRSERAPSGRPSSLRRSTFLKWVESSGAHGHSPDLVS